MNKCVEPQGTEPPLWYLLENRLQLDLDKNSCGHKDAVHECQKKRRRRIEERRGESGVHRFVHIYLRQCQGLVAAKWRVGGGE